MAIRHIIFAAFMASACAAHADVIPSGAGAATLSSNLPLIGGAAFGTGPTHAIGGAGQAGLYSSAGIEGLYLLGSGHGILAAMFGSGLPPASASGMANGAGGIAVTGIGMGGASGGVSGDIVAATSSVGASTGTRGVIGGQAVAPKAAAAIPEPSTTALMLIGMIGAGALTRRRTR